MVVYKITNLLSNKMYVGQTIRDYKKRLKEHRKNKDSYIGRSIKAHGIENFKVEVVCECTSIEDLNNKERDFVIICNSMFPNGYNLKEGGNRPKYSQESRDKISKSNMGKKITQSQLEGLKIGWYRKGFTHSEESLEKMRQGHKNRVVTETQLRGLDIGREKAGRAIIATNLVTGEQINFARIKYAIETLKISKTSIHRILSGNQKSSKGFFFEYQQSMGNVKG